jgi:hypothetical protein
MPTCSRMTACTAAVMQQPHCHCCRRCRRHHWRRRWATTTSTPAPACRWRPAGRCPAPPATRSATDLRGQRSVVGRGCVSRDAGCNRCCAGLSKGSAAHSGLRGVLQPDQLGMHKQRDAPPANMRFARTSARLTCAADQAQSAAHIVLLKRAPVADVVRLHPLPHIRVVLHRGGED